MLIKYVGNCWRVYTSSGSLIDARLAMFVAILFMQILTPKTMPEQYFKPSYFKEVECHLFTGITLAPIRTVMFMMALAFPKRGSRRK